jgi:hypothetical protein
MEVGIESLEFSGLFILRMDVESAGFSAAVKVF